MMTGLSVHLTPHNLQMYVIPVFWSSQVHAQMHSFTEFFQKVIWLMQPSQLVQLVAEICTSAKKNNHPIEQVSDIN
jgi:hypothetical protein